MAAPVTTGASGAVTYGTPGEGPATTVNYAAPGAPTSSTAEHTHTTYGVPAALQEHVAFQAPHPEVQVRAGATPYMVAAAGAPAPEAGSYGPPPEGPAQSVVYGVPQAAPAQYNMAVTYNAAPQTVTYTNPEP